MALQGNLQDFSITQLLNLINLAKKSGALLVRSSAGSGRVQFHNGEMVFAQMDEEPHNLSRILFKAKKITDNQMQSLQERRGNMSDKELGLLIVNAGNLSQHEIVESLRAHFSNVVRDFFSWDEGQFKFDDTQQLSSDNIPVSISVDNLVIEGSRLVQEADQLKLEIPDLNMALAFAERPGIDLKKFSLSVDEWRVVSYINPKNTIKQIAKASKNNDAQIRRIVFSLLEAGIVRMVRPAGAPTQLDGLESAFPGVERNEQKTLVTRLIERIRSI
jgi:hypothetical protein